MPRILALAMLSDLKNEDTLQGVVIADSYDRRFGPLTLNTPKCLLPLANRPMLNYALACLKSCGIHDIIVYCTSHADQIKAHLAGMKSDLGSITVITNEEGRSFGDAIRDLDVKGLLRQNFVLMQADSVANLDLIPILERHKKRLMEDRNASMTMVYKKAAPCHPGRTLDEEVFVVTNGDDNRVIHHQKAHSTKLNVPLELLDGIDEVRLCFDLMETGIAVCSPSIPPLFADNFDFQTMDDFLKGVIENDLIENTIYIHEVDEHYAARVSNLLTYQAVTQDVLNRWSFPFVPDMILVGLEKNRDYRYERHNVYKGKNVIVEKGGLLKENVIVGSGTCIGQSSSIENSAISAKCRIGKNVTIINSIIHEGVVIGDNCCIEGAVIGANSKLASDVIIHERCVLGDHVELEAKYDLPHGSRITSQLQDSGFSDDEDNTNDEDHDSLKIGMKAYKYVDDVEEEDDDDEVEVITKDIWGLSLKDLNMSEDDSSSDESDIEGLEDACDIMLDDDAKFSVFNAEVFESLHRGFKEGIKADNLILEINSSRHAYAVSSNQVVHSVCSAVFAIPGQQGEDISGPKLLKEIQKVIKAFSPILSKYVKDSSAQIECLFTLEQHCKDHSDYLAVAMKTIHFLYETDIISEDAVLVWFGQADRHPSFGPGFRKKIQPFIDWLEESEDDDEEEESD